MSGVGERKSNIQWKCDNCFNEFNSFRALHLHRNKHCFPDKTRKRVPQKSKHLENLDEELPAESSQYILEI